MESLVKKNNLKVSAIYTIYKSSKGFGNAQFDLKARDCQLTQKQFLFQLNLCDKVVLANPDTYDIRKGHLDQMVRPKTSHVRV